MDTTARVFSLVQEGIRNFERPIFADQLDTQGREHSTDTDPMEQDDVPPPFFDRLGMQERKHFMDTNSLSMKKNFARRGVQDLKRPPLLGCLDLERGVQDLARVLPLCCLDVGGRALDVETARTLHTEIPSPLDVEGQARGSDRAERLQPETSSPFDLLDSFICGATLQSFRRRGNQSLVEGCSTPPGDKIGGGNG